MNGPTRREIHLHFTFRRHFFSAIRFLSAKLPAAKFQIIQENYTNISVSRIQFVIRHAQWTSGSPGRYTAEKRHQRK